MIFVAGLVVTVGRRGAVLKVWSAPKTVPFAFVATTRKWYDVLCDNPAIAAFTDTSVALLPMFWANVVVP